MNRSADGPVRSNFEPNKELRVRTPALQSGSWSRSVVEGASRRPVFAEAQEFFMNRVYANLSPVNSAFRPGEIITR